MISAISSALERIGEDNRFVPIRAHGDEYHPDSGQGLKTFDIAPGVPGKVCDPFGSSDILRPAIQLLVDGPALHEKAEVGWHGFGELLPLTPVAGANFQLRNSCQDVEFGQGDTGDAGEPNSMADQNHVKPAASALTACRGAEFLTYLLELGSRFIIELR